MNKRTNYLLLALLLSSPTAFAGGLLENTNQSISFLRNPSRDATIGIDGVYSNPAGVVFLKDGWHLEFNWMMVHQDRDTKSKYGELFKYNINNPTLPALDEKGYRAFDGDVNVPIQPSLFLAYNKKDWSFQFGFGFVGGGGGCEFSNGLGSFEGLIGGILAPQYLMAVNKMTGSNYNFAGYGMKSYLKGTSYDLGLTVGIARKLFKDFSAYVGLRGIILINKYQGFIKDIAVRGIDEKGNTEIIPYTDSFILDCRQNGFGIAPIIGIDYKINKHWNLAAKCEFKTKLTATTTANNNEAFNNLANGNETFAGYVDGAKTSQDLPIYLTAGVQYSPINNVRIMGGYHHYFDMDTRQYSKDLVGYTNEITFGAEWDVSRKLEISGGVQKTWYRLDDKLETDSNFALDSYSLGCGIGIDISDKIKLNVAYFQTNYLDKEIKTDDSEIHFRRTNRILGLGVDWNF